MSTSLTCTKRKAYRATLRSTFTCAQTERILDNLEDRAHSDLYSSNEIELGHISRSYRRRCRPAHPEATPHFFAMGRPWIDADLLTVRISQ